MKIRKDISGVRFGRLVACEPCGKSKNCQTIWLCKCDCGKEKAVRLDSLLNGAIRSCGCLAAETTRARATKHGQSGTPHYVQLMAMIQRCHNPNNTEYKNYGGRGISVCKRWRDSFEDFMLDMGPVPDGMERPTVERKDVHGNYCPDNCCWLPKKLQMLNTRVNRVIEIGGVARCVTEWGEVVGIARNTIFGRLWRGWSPEDAVTRPLGYRRA